MLTLKNIRKSYQTRDFIQHALNGVSISFRKNEFAAVLGASGSGKTTLLNIIGGLDRADDGELLIDNVSTLKYKAADWDVYRNNRVGFIFQSYNLIPHQSVLDNVELALTLSGIPKTIRRERAIKALDEVGLKDHIYKLPTQLSGGQMQRVAIARSLVNDPEIVLADEPTGALDSTTGLSIMEILKEVAQDRLVIMVTHNPELANKYANRIVKLKDGEVMSDSNPFLQESEKVSITEKLKHLKMSFFTALSLSLSNLKTKIGRTLITALAGSIGIIGIASILALASGINLYIDDIEQETMSAYPLTLDASGIDISGFISSANKIHQSSKSPDLEDDEAFVLNSLTSLFVNQRQNDLKSFKNYLENNPELIEPYVKNIQYKYGITPQIYLESTDGKIHQVNPDSILANFGIGSTPGMSIISGDSEMGGMRTFQELAGDVSNFVDQYDVLVGKWPENKNELVVVLMENGAVSDFTLYALGLKDRNQLESMLEQLFNQGEGNTNDEVLSESINFNQLLNRNLKVINSALKYHYDSNYQVFIDKSDDNKVMQGIIQDGLDLTVVGVVKAKDTTKTPTLTSGIYYHKTLIPYLIDQAANSEIVIKQLEHPEINVLTNKSFVEEGNFDPKDVFNFEKFISIDQSYLKQAFKFNNLPNDFDFDFDLSNLNLDDLNLAPLIEALANQLQLSTSDLVNLFTEIIEDFIDAYNPTDIQDWTDNLQAYLASPEVQDKIKDKFNDLDLSDQITAIITNYFSGMINDLLNNVMSSIQNQITQELTENFGALASSLKIDQAMLAKAFKFNIDENEIISLLTGLTNQNVTNLASNLKKFGYRDLEDPSQINIYPKDFSTKDDVISFIDTYNLNMENTNQSAKVVKYSDLVGSLMSSVTTIINTISYALIAFVAISLIVSSIMIGVITYVSVLERIKEIGILRAIGASKKDIKRVFNAETLIIGFVAGALGIGVTFVISKIASAIVLKHFDIANIAYLKINHALILILISMVLAFIAGLIPAASAAKKDPVEALRTE